MMLGMFQCCGDGTRRAVRGFLGASDRRGGFSVRRYRCDVLRDK